MFSRCLSVLLVLAAGACAETRVLRVCADPNNLPYSNQRGEGFENRLAELFARSLDAKLEYTWWSERKSSIRNALADGRCDLWMEVPAAMDGVATTRPYYRSTYVFVSRRDRGPAVVSLDDPRLDHWRIGVHVVGDDYAPPAHALARRGLAANIVGFPLFGPYGEQNPAARIIDAVAKGEIDVAIAWGPLAGYFAKRASMAMDVTPVTPARFLEIPFTFEMALGVRKGDLERKAELEKVLERECGRIQSILREFGVPLVPASEGESACASQRQLSSVSSR